jgi:adenylate cyclase
MALLQADSGPVAAPTSFERLGDGLRRRWRAATRSCEAATSVRLRRVLRQEELRGLAFAFRARSIAAVAVGLWLVLLVPAPRVFYYLGVVALFFILGLVPHLLRGHRHGQIFKLAFILLDVLLIVAVILTPPPFDSTDWPIQTRLRFQDYLYVLLYLVGSALSYSALNVIWTGLCTVAVWSAGFLWLYTRPDTVTWNNRFGDRAGVPASESLALILDPNYVGISQLWNQVVLTLIMTALLVAAVARSRRTLVRQAKAEAVRADLARYLSPDVADTLASRPDASFGAPANRQVAVLFADIVGFTSYTEGLPPDRVVALLRSFHARACRVVFRHRGTLDKFLGDGFMATFGTLAAHEGSAREALACAFALQEEMDRWGAKRRERGAPPLTVVIGVHYGPAVVGNVGAEQRLEFTVVGDTVNVASRLERLTREHACRIALTGDALQAAGGSDALGVRFEPRGPVTLRGRTQPVELYVWPPETTAGAGSSDP